VVIIVIIYYYHFFDAIRIAVTLIRIITLNVIIIAVIRIIYMDTG
jgi:hypothetical protein